MKENDLVYRRADPHKRAWRIICVDRCGVAFRVYVVDAEDDTTDLANALDFIVIRGSVCNPLIKLNPLELLAREAVN